MKLEGVELRRITMPLVAPFRTSFGTEHDREVVLVRIVTESAEGWGECVAMTEPLYSSEYVDAAADVIRRFLVPALGALRDVEVHAAERAFARIKGHPMAKAAVEAALLDAQLRQAGMSLGTFLGAVHEAVPAGVSVGIMDSVPELLDAVDGYLAEGYLRIKLKIEPGWDVAPVRAVRERFGDDLLLQVDANTAYTLADARQLAKLDPFDLLLSARAAAEAIRIGATRIVNIKPGRVGGYLEARRIHDVCAANGVPVWCGGMLETGIGRAANIALAALPNFTLPGDTSASNRYYLRDITTPVVLEDGHVRVPVGDGIGVVPDQDALDDVTVSTEWLPS